MKKFIALIAISLCTIGYGQNGLHLDGTNDFVNTTFTGVSGNLSRTVEAWIKTTANANPSSSGVQQIITDWGASSTGARFTFNILWGNALRLEVAGNGVSGSIAVNDGQWHHVAAVYDASATLKVSLYVDGVLDTNANLTVAVNTLSSVPLQIGKRVDGARHFEGSIDEVRIWDYARTPAEILAQKDNEICGTPTGLVAYYKLNQGAASGINTGINTAIDYSSNSNNGTLSNFGLAGAYSNWVAGATLATGATKDSIAVNSCGEYLSPAGHTYNIGGTYLDTLMNQAGCDSLLTINLSVYSVDTTVLQDSIQLTANQFATSYQWVDCDANFTFITGATQQGYSPTQSGNYAVIIDVNGCIDTSECVTFSGIDLKDHPLQSLKLYPNPTTGVVHFSLKEKVNIRALKIKSATGVCLFEQNQNLEDNPLLHFGSYAPGIYFLEIWIDDRVYTRKILVN